MRLRLRSGRPGDVPLAGEELAHGPPDVVRGEVAVGGQRQQPRDDESHERALPASEARGHGPTSIWT